MMMMMVVVVVVMMVMMMMTTTATMMMIMMITMKEKRDQDPQNEPQDICMYRWKRLEVISVPMPSRMLRRGSEFGVVDTALGPRQPRRRPPHSSCGRFCLCPPLSLRRSLNRWFTPSPLLFPFPSPPPRPLHFCTSRFLVAPLSFSS